MNANQTYIMFNTASVGAAYFMLGLSLWLAPVDLSTKGLLGHGHPSAHGQPREPGQVPHR